MKKVISNIIKDWVEKNKQVFWKYEVTSYNRPYKICVRNLPNPSEDDISVSKHNQLLKNDKKTQLCKAIKKECAKEKAITITGIDVEVNYEDGKITAAVVSAGQKELV
jgi:hypothetical protein